MPTDLNTVKRDWFFTFGSGHSHPSGYVKIFGTFDSVREEMCNRYGEKWAFQYKSSEEAGVDKYRLYEILYEDDEKFVTEIGEFRKDM